VIQQLWTLLLRAATETAPDMQALQQQRLKLKNNENVMTSLTITTFNQSWSKLLV